MFKYIVVDSNNRPVSPEVNTPSRAQFYLRAFASIRPEARYAIEIVKAA